MADFDPQDIIGTPPNRKGKKVKGDFDPEDIISPAAAPELEPQVAKKSDFDQEDIVSFSAPTAPPITSSAIPTTSEPKKSENKGFRTEFVKPEEVLAIADKYKVDPNKLLNAAPYRGAMLSPKEGEKPSLVESLKQGAKGTLAAIDKGILFGAGEFAYKKMQDPNTRAAIDELDNLIESRRGWQDFTNEVGLGIAGTSGKLAAKALEKAPTLTEKLGNVAKGLGGGAGLGAAAGLFGSEEGKEKQGAAVGAVLGTGLAAAPMAVSGAFKGAKKLGGWFAGLGQKIEQVQPELIEQAAEKIKGKVDTTDLNKASEILGLSPELTQDLQKRDPKLFQTKLEQALIVDEVAKDAVQANYASTWGEEGLKLFGRAKQNLRLADAKHNTNMEILANKVSAGEKQYLWDMHELYNKHKDIKKLDGPLEAEQVFSVLNAPKAEGQKLYTSLSPEGKQQVDKYREAFEWGRQTANSGEDALNIPKFQDTFGYVPAKAKRGPEAVIAFDNQTQKAAESLGLTKEQFLNNLDDPKWVQKNILSGKFPNKEVADLTQGLKYISPNEEFKLNNYRDFQNAFEIALNPTETGAGKNYLTAKALFARDNIDKVLPDFLRDKNVDSLLQRWGSDTFRYKHLRLPMEELEGQALAIKQKGDIGTYKYVNNYLQDLAGTRDTFGRKLKNAATQWETGLLTKAEQLKNTDPALAKTYEFAAGVPDLLHMAGQQMYPYYLGLRIDKAARNLTQPYLMTAAEISGAGSPAYGYKKLLSNVKDYVPGTQSREEMLSYLRKTGQIGPDFQGEQIRWMRDGLKAGGVANETLEKANNVAMYLYSKSDQENRIITGAAAKSVIQDLFSQDKKAQQEAVASIKSWAPSYKKAIEKAYLDKDPETARRLATEYLIDNTQFNYDRASMSNYGRYMGGLFNMFSTWPSAIGGDIYLNARGISGTAKDRMQKNTMKYLGPLLATVAAQQLYESSGGKETPLGRQAVGKDVRSVAPASSLMQVSQGQLGPPPLIEGAKTAKAALSGDTLGLGKQGEKLKALVPGAVYYERVVQDLPDWLEIVRGRGLEPQEQYKLSPLEGQKVPTRNK